MTSRLVQLFWATFHLMLREMNVTKALPDERLRGTDASTPIFVDIGGGHGFQCAAFGAAAAAAGWPGRVIHQDLPGTLAAAPAYPGVAKMEQDFFSRQQIRGMGVKPVSFRSRQIHSLTTCIGFCGPF